MLFVFTQIQFLYKYQVHTATTNSVVAKEQEVSGSTWYRTFKVVETYVSNKKKQKITKLNPRIELGTFRLQVECSTTKLIQLLV